MSLINYLGFKMENRVIPLFGLLTIRILGNTVGEIATQGWTKHVIIQLLYNLIFVLKNKVRFVKKLPDFSY